MINFEIRILKRISDNKGTEYIHQFRIKDVWVDSSTTTPVPRDWSEWKDVPIVFED